MNPAMKAKEDWAEIAGLLNAGNGHAFFTSERKFRVTLFVDKEVAASLAPWLKQKGRKFRVDRARNRDRIRFLFMGREAVNVLNMTHDRLRDPALKRRAALAFAYWRTIQKPGFRIPDAARKERLRVLSEFEKLKQA